MNTIKEYLDSPLADNKDDASDLRAAIAKAARKRNSKIYNRPEDQFSGTGRRKCKPWSFFFRDFSQGGEASGGSFTNGNNIPEVQNASTVINLDTLQGAVPSEETPQLHSAPQ